MYSDMPGLVDANTGHPAPNSGWPQPSGPDPWATGISGGGVTPGGFGAAIPLPQQGGRSQPFGPNAAMMGETQPLSFGAPAMGTPHPAMRGFPGASPWMPASTFDQGLGPSLTRQNPYPQVGMESGPSWPGFGAGVAPAARQRPQNAPWLTPQSTRHQQPAGWDDEEEEFDEGYENGTWGPADGWGGADGWGTSNWGSSPGLSPWDMPGTPLRRTRSAGAAGSSMTQNASPRYKYPRPENWRPNYTPRPVGLKRLLSFGKGKGAQNGEFGRERSLSFRSLLGRSGTHWSLDGRDRVCSWDIRYPPQTAFMLRSGNRPLDFIELHESAFDPPTCRARIVHPLLPWYIYINVQNGSIITVSALLETLFFELQKPVVHSDFWNDAISEEDRKAIHGAWRVRVGTNRELAEEGIKRIDFLCQRVMFEGLKRVGDDWELKMKAHK